MVDLAHRPAGLGALVGSGKPLTILAAELSDLDALVTTLATATGIVDLTGAGLTGALANPGPATYKCAFTVLLTRTDDAGSYTNGAVITFTGTLNGVAVTETITLPDADGPDTLYGSTRQEFDSLTNINIPAMVDTDGAWTFGMWGIKPLRWIREVKPLADGTLGYIDDEGTLQALTVKSLSSEPMFTNEIQTSTGDLNIYL